MKKIKDIIIRKATHFGFYYMPITFSKVAYKFKMGRKLNLKNPKSLSEKINYLNIYEENEIASKGADKYKVRSFIEEAGYGEYLVELIGVYNKVDEIDFEKLPSKFVLKCTHGCGYNIICKDKTKLDIETVKNKLNMWMKEQYGYRGGEFHYNKIEPKIICEKYIDGLEEEKLPIDYKIHCFNGKPVFTLCCSNREESLKLDVYDKNWNKIDAIIEKYKSNKHIEKPKDYEKMLEIAETLSKDIKIVRVDFYELDGKALLGELTFTPAAGRPNYFTREFDEEIGLKILIS